MKRFDFLRGGARLRKPPASAPFAPQAIAVAGIAFALALAVATELVAIHAAVRRAGDDARYASARSASALALFQERRTWQLRERRAHMRALQASGRLAAIELSRIAEALPADAWLNSIVRTPGGYELSGSAAGVGAAADLVAALNEKLKGSPVLERLDSAAGDTVAFRVTIAEFR